MNFKDSHFLKEIILMSIQWYVSYPVSYRYVEELMGECGVYLDHATVNQWVVKYFPLLESEFRKFKHSIGKNWKVDETYIHVKGKVYYHRTVDKEKQTIDFFLSSTRDTEAASPFFEKAIDSSVLPEKVNLDKNGSNLAGLHCVNQALPERQTIVIRQVKYLNCRIEQNLRAIKRIIKPKMRFKNFVCAAATLVGMELAHTIKKELRLLTKFLPP